MPTLGEIAKRDAAAGDTFLTQQNGADFAADLHPNAVAASGTEGHFTPVWFSSGPNLLTNAAYCLYRLTFDPQATSATLKLNWLSGPSASSSCWIGLSDWSTGRWRWQPLDTTNTVPLDVPADYINASSESYVAVVVLGQDPCSLATISYSVPTPPGDGYTLVAPLIDTSTYLIDMDGNTVHQWSSGYWPGASARLMPNGHLLRLENLKNPSFSSGGEGGRLAEQDWDGNDIWHYDLNTTTQCLHHDFCPLPNGDILLVVWNLIPDAQIIDAGRDPATIDSGRFWADSIIEIQPTMPEGGTIVWQWQDVDHLVQDFDISKQNYGSPAQHPELINLNYPSGPPPGDWTHINSVVYNAALDQIILTSPNFSEIWVIDHSTTTAEAASHSGGRYGHGGDLLYRWGNPQAYKQGDAADQKLFFCHNGQWIPDGLDGAGQILVFDNQAGRGPLYTTVVQFTPPQNPDGSYNLTGNSYGPDSLSWQYVADPPDSFFSANMGSVQRLPGGNTLICCAVKGWIFEVDPAGKIVWQYQNTHPAVQPQVFRATRYAYDYPGVAALQQ